MEKNKHLIVVHIPTKESLDKNKLVECETYDSVITRAIKALESQ
jgi:hypothetical protein